jgi:cyanophycinase
MQLRWLTALLFAGFLLLPAPGAEEKQPPKERLRPEGIDGQLILTGDKVPDAARDRFLELAGKEKARIVILVTTDAKRTDTAEKLAEAWKAGKADVSIQAGDGGISDELRNALKQATGVWLMTDTLLIDDLRGVMKRGVLAASGRGAEALGQALVRSGPPRGLLAGAVVEPYFAKDPRALAVTLDKNPGLFGIGLGDESALLIRGRDMTVLAGEVTIVLAKSAKREPRSVRLTVRTPSDLTMWRRAAIARTEAPFPPNPVPVPEVPKGTLIIVGGGGMPADLTKKFIELAGGPDALIVVLPTANPDPLPPGDSEGAMFKRAGAKNVVVLRGRTLAEVEDPKNLEVLKKAGGVWFGGGRQWRFVDAYEGTKAHEAFRDVLRRGGVIGGSSAGATIQGDYLCRGSPLGNLEMMCEGYERGLGFLPGVAVDQHFAQRNRFADITELMKVYPKLLGIGLDETTAIVVQGHVAEVVGKGEVHFYDSNKPVEAGKPDHESIKAGGRYDLKERKILP